MKITVITGSPRKNGNTFAMVDAFIKAAESKGHMPVYWYSIPSQIKGVIDRIFSFCVAGKDISGKKCGVITCCEEHDRTVMDGITNHLHRTFDLLKWNLVGEVCITGVFKEGDITDTDGCAEAAALADKF